MGKEDNLISSREKDGESVEERKVSETAKKTSLDISMEKQTGECSDMKKSSSVQRAEFYEKLMVEIEEVKKDSQDHVSTDIKDKESEPQKETDSSELLSGQDKESKSVTKEKLVTEKDSVDEKETPEVEQKVKSPTDKDSWISETV